MLYNIVIMDQLILNAGVFNCWTYNQPVDNLGLRIAYFNITATIRLQQSTLVLITLMKRFFTVIIRGS